MAQAAKFGRSPSWRTVTTEAPAIPPSILSYTAAMPAQFQPIATAMSADEKARDTSTARNPARTTDHA